MAQNFEGPVNVEGTLRASRSIIVGREDGVVEPDVHLDVMGLIFTPLGIDVAADGHIDVGRLSVSHIRQHAQVSQVLLEGGLGVTKNLNVNGDIAVMGDVKLVGADLAEQFRVGGQIPAEPGCVVVLAGPDEVRVSETAYDRRVAGVVSGAGNYRPAVLLDSHQTAGSMPLALSGKVWCKADADIAPIQVGDLLTTSAIPGHAMQAVDPTRAFGSVLGKALGSLSSGQGLIPVLVALQ